mgnify:CR=1 FL=1
MIVLIVATYSYMPLAEPSVQGQDALLSHRASPRRHGEPGAYAKRYVLEPWWIVQRVSSIGMALVMRSTSGMGVAVARSGCSTFCNPERGYGSASGSMRTRNGSRGWYRPSCSGRILVRRSGRRGCDGDSLLTFSHTVCPLPIPLYRTTKRSHIWITANCPSTINYKATTINITSVVTC